MKDIVDFEREYRGKSLVFNKLQWRLIEEYCIAEICSEIQRIRKSENVGYITKLDIALETESRYLMTMITKYADRIKDDCQLGRFTQFVGECKNVSAHSIEFHDSDNAIEQSKDGNIIVHVSGIKYGLLNDTCINYRLGY